MTNPSPEEDCIIIQRSKLKLIFLFLIGIAFAIVGYQLTKNADSYAVDSHTPAFFIMFIGVLAMVLLGIGGTFTAIWLFFSKKPGLRIDTEGITTYGLSSKFIAWADISGFKILEIKRSKLIGIFLNNSEDYIAQQKNGLKRMLMQWNYSGFGAALSINTNDLKYKADDLNALLNSRLSNYKKSHHHNPAYQNSLDN